MTLKQIRFAAIFSIILGGIVWFCYASDQSNSAVEAGRQEVVFWHFWGGADRAIVDKIVDQFNESQDEHWVRAVAMPGNNLDLKLFLSVTGGDAPDLVNQDDPIVADWASRDVLTPLSELAEPNEYERLNDWLFPAAKRLGTYDDQLFALCNGLDIRALYYNQTLLDEFSLEPPKSIEDLNQIAHTIAPPSKTEHDRYGYLPDPRRLWAWGTVFGGSFYDTNSGKATANSPQIVDALTWMTSFAEDYGRNEIAAFRVADQSLPGKPFPLLAGRYAVIMDGQWRVRDIAAAQAAEVAANKPVTRYGVCPLPPPPSGKQKAGWVNGNFFIVPRHGKNPIGAWKFMKFWSGFDGNEATAAQACARGGWIPASEHVVNQRTFQQFLREQPLFASFVELAASPNQIPTPLVPGAPFFNNEIKSVGSSSMYRGDETPKQLLEDANQRIQSKLDGVH